MIKKWLKRKLSAWLEIDHLKKNVLLISENIEDMTQIHKSTAEVLKKHKTDLDELDSKFSQREGIVSNRLRGYDIQINAQDERIMKLFHTVENVVHIGTDVQRDEYRGHSWAVVCIEGKINIVKFVSLDRQDARHICDFLKQFEAGRHCIDAFPPQPFYNMLFKFEEDDKNG